MRAAPLLIAAIAVACALPTRGARADTGMGRIEAEGLGRGPEMGPIDSERPAAPNIARDRHDDGVLDRRTAALEDFAETSLDMAPASVTRLPRWGLELRFGPFGPQFSTAPAGHALYELMLVRDNTRSLFNGRPMLMAIEGEYYLLRTLGLLGVFGRVGYWQATAPSRACVAADGTTPVACSAATVGSSVKGNDTTALTALPVSLGVVWRLDMLRRRTVVPLTFSLKASLDDHLWWASSGGRPARYRGRHARGMTLGYTLAAGVSLSLDGFAKRTLGRSASHVENSLFAEYALVRGHALVGRSRHARVDWTDNALVVVGLACDFK